MYDHNPYTSLEQRDVLGEVIERTEREYPYSFSRHCAWVASEKVLEEANKLGNTGNVYSDRLYEQDCNKYNQVCRDVFGDEGQYFDNRSDKKIEKFLRKYLEVPDLVLTHVHKECNVGNGYPTWSFKYSHK